VLGATFSNTQGDATREPLEYFAAPEFESTGGTGRIMAYSYVGPGETQPCVLPVGFVKRCARA